MKNNLYFLPTTIHIVRGTTKKINLTVLSIDGYQGLLFKPKDEIFFGIKRRPADKEYISIQKIAAPIDSNTIEIKIEPINTQYESFGEHYYDIGLKRDKDYYNLVKCSLLIIEPNITEKKNE